METGQDKIWSNYTISDVLNSFGIEPEKGLINSSLPALKEQYGKNELPADKHKTIFSIFIHQFASPLVYLLLIACVAAYFLGRVDDAIVILVVVLLNSIIGTIQEGKAEKSLESLRKLSTVKTVVVRDGIEQYIQASELLPGDIVRLAAGDAIPADGRLIEVVNFSTSEAALTGESLPVQKSIKVISGKPAPSDQNNMVFSGTHVLTGRANMVVTNIGLSTELGKIAHLTATTVDTATPLEKKIKVFGHKLIAIAAILLGAVILIGLRNGLERGEILMIGISQIVGLIPEGLPIAVTVALAVGVQRMARRGAIVRKLSAVETLGSTTVICSDKTGTLTKNEMTVVKVALGSGTQLDVTGAGLSPEGEILSTTDAFKQSREYIYFNYACVLCNDSSIKQDEHSKWSATGDPTESALLTFAMKGGLKVDELRAKHNRVNEIPFDSDRKIMLTENTFEDENKVFIKGAAEKILKLSSRFLENDNPKQIDESKRKELFKKLDEMSLNGLRVLGLGLYNGSLDPNASDEELMGEVCFLGFVGQIDPPREEVFTAIDECKKAGIRTVMVTGDHKITGHSIAKTLGIAQDDSRALDGGELANLNEDEFKEVANDVSVFARIRPSQKLDIVKTYQDLNHVVAMTGDGVNDAPALSKADVGVAMGITGTEVSKQASKIVITDDNFSTIVAAIEEGRIVYGNLKKVVLYLMSTSIAEVTILLIALITGLLPPLAAVQILWINLVTEGLVTINLILEPGEGNEMNRKPVDPSEPILSKDIMFRLIFLTCTISAVTFSWYFYRVKTGVDHSIVQTETFTLLALTQWFNVLNCRSSTKSAISFSIFKNKWLLGGLIIGNILQVLVVYWRPLGDVFHTTAIGIKEVVLLGLVASIVLWVEEIRKFFTR
jgi:magnesium-transporting ATPase (P-type)